MKNISCCFSGHREIEKSEIPVVSQRLDEEIRKLIDKGYTEFFTGGALGFDTLAAKAVLDIKEEFPFIHLHIIMPCLNQTRGWNEKSRAVHEEINSLADEVKCLSEKYYTGCMQVRNRYMVDSSSVLIAYITKDSGGSAYTKKYAVKNGLDVINIAEAR